MTDLSVFAFDSQAVRVVLVDGEPWFVAADVCAILGFGNPRQAIESHVDEDDVQKLDAIDSLGRTQPTNHVNESGLYALIFGSTKPEAKRFKRWVTHDVLPAIRKTGAYIDPAAPGAMGVQGQPMPYLSHVADFHVAADRVFRSVLRSARSAGVPLPTAVRQASAVTQAQTGMDMIGLLDAHAHLQALDAREAAQQPVRHAGSARFWQEWAGGELEGLPYQSCLAAQAYQAYTHWCALMREAETARREVFTATVIEAAAQAGQAVRVKPMRIGAREGGSVERVLLVSAPPLEGQGAWATALVTQFAEHLRAYLAHKRSGVMERSPCT